MPTVERRSYAIKTSTKAGGGASAESVKDARRALTEEGIKAVVEAVVAAAPALTAEQHDRLAVLLRGA